MTKPNKITLRLCDPYGLYTSEAIHVKGSRHPHYLESVDPPVTNSNDWLDIEEHLRAAGEDLTHDPACAICAAVEIKKNVPFRVPAPPHADMLEQTALITGITGQDGSYLAELLLDKGYAVHGIIRRSSSFNTARIDHIFDQLTLHYGDLTDPLSLRAVIGKVKPDEVYNLAAQSHVKVSFEEPAYTFAVNAQGALNLLECLRDFRDATGKEVRCYQASSSEMFGSSPPPQNEATPFRPCSPYGVSKVAAFHAAVNYREAYGLFVANGILFNHESPRRGETFVTRKVTRAATRIQLGLQEVLTLGNIYARRDWGFAGDYVEAMWRMLQHDKPDDFVIGTGEWMDVEHWLGMTFGLCGVRHWDPYVKTDPRYFRPREVDHLQADATKARDVLGWSPQTGAGELCRMMIDSDRELAERELALKQAGHAPSLVSC